MKKKSFRTFTLLDLVLYLFITAIMLVTLLPIIHMVAISLSSDIYVLQGKVGLIPKGFTTKMYQLVFEDARIFRSYGNTLFYTVLGTVLSLFITAMGAYALSNTRMIGHRFFSMMIIFTMFFSGGMIPTFLVVKSYNLLDTIWAVILPGVVSTWNFLVMKSFFDNFPGEIVESGRVDGLTDAGIFFRLVLPTSKAVLATIGLYYAVGYWNAYFTPFIYLTKPDLFPLQLILREILSTGSSNNAAVGVGDVLVVAESLQYATVVVAIVPIIAVYPFLQKYFVKGVMIGAVKG
jgi:putative aldouronate transport system permease protein